MPGRRRRPAGCGEGRPLLPDDEAARSRGRARAAARLRPRRPLARRGPPVGRVLPGHQRPGVQGHPGGAGRVRRLQVRREQPGGAAQGGGGHRRPRPPRPPGRHRGDRERGVQPAGPFAAGQRVGGGRRQRPGHRLQPLPGEHQPAGARPRPLRGPAGGHGRPGGGGAWPRPLCGGWGGVWGGVWGQRWVVSLTRSGGPPLLFSSSSSCNPTPPLTRPRHTPLPPFPFQNFSS